MASEREGLFNLAVAYSANVDNPCFVGMIPVLTNSQEGSSEWLLQREMTPKEGGAGRAHVKGASSALLAVLGFIRDKEKSL